MSIHPASSSSRLLYHLTSKASNLRNLALKANDATSEQDDARGHAASGWQTRRPRCTPIQTGVYRVMVVSDKTVTILISRQTAFALKSEAEGCLWSVYIRSNGTAIKLQCFRNAIYHILLACGVQSWDRWGKSWKRRDRASEGTWE